MRQLRKENKSEQEEKASVSCFWEMRSKSSFFYQGEVRGAVIQKGNRSCFWERRRRRSCFWDRRRKSSCFGDRGIKRSILRGVVSISCQLSAASCQLSAVSCQMPDRLKNVNANFLSWPSPLFYEGTINTMTLIYLWIYLLLCSTQNKFGTEDKGKFKWSFLSCRQVLLSYSVKQ